MPQNANLNMGTLLIDISDGSKDNSSHNTPNFASPKSANTPTQFFEGGVNVATFNDDLEVVSKPSSKFKSQNVVIHISLNSIE